LFAYNLLTSGFQRATPATTNYEFGTLWQSFCAGYAIPAETLLSSRKIRHQLTDKLEKRQFAARPCDVNFEYLDPNAA
jgi:hypothetical protein